MDRVSLIGNNLYNRKIIEKIGKNLSYLAEDLKKITLHFLTPYCRHSVTKYR